MHPAQLRPATPYDEEPSAVAQAAYIRKTQLAGQVASGTMAPAPRPEIHSILESIHDRLNHADRTLNKLQERLEPLTAPYPCNPNGQAQDNIGGSCQISQALLIFHSRIDQFCQRIEAQIDHLQI